MGYVDYMQRRIITKMVHRNMRGWGRPLSFSKQRCNLGSLFSGTGVVLAIIDISIFGMHGVLTKGNFIEVLLDIMALLTLFIGVGLLWNSIPVLWKAQNQSPKAVRGTVDAAICNVQDYVTYASGDYHFITVKHPDGQLRAYALEPSLHEKLCLAGKDVAFQVESGTEHVTL